MDLKESFKKMKSELDSEKFKKNVEKRREDFVESRLMNPIVIIVWLVLMITFFVYLYFVYYGV